MMCLIDVFDHHSRMFVPLLEESSIFVKTSETHTVSNTCVEGAFAHFTLGIQFSFSEQL